MYQVYMNQHSECNKKDLLDTVMLCCRVGDLGKGHLHICEATLKQGRTFFLQCKPTCSTHYHEMNKQVLAFLACPKQSGFGICKNNTTNNKKTNNGMYCYNSK